MIHIISMINTPWIVVQNSQPNILCQSATSNTMDTSYSSIILIGLYCFNWLVLTPISLYGAYKFWALTKQDIPFFTKRHPKFVIMYIILLNLYPTIIRPSIDIPRYVFNAIPHNHPIVSFVANLSHISGVLWLVRLWLLYYDYTHSQQTLSLKWKQVILKEKISTPWPMRNKWAGNSKIITVIAMSLFLIFQVIIM